MVLAIDKNEIKANTNILQVVQSSLGQPLKKSGRWYFWPCPFHAEKNASFTVTPDNGRWHCFSCGHGGDVIDWIQETEHLPFLEALKSLNGNSHWTEADKQAYQDELKRREQEEMEHKRQALDKMEEQLPVAMDYHDGMASRAYWYTQGLTDTTIDLFGLGYCPSCPTYPASPSWTIPVTFKGRLLNVRHRLAEPPSPGDKYRPHMIGLPAILFNADVLLQRNDFVVLTEGEVKAIYLSQMGIPTVGIPGKNIFPDRWVKWFTQQPTVYIALDPDANGHAAGIGHMLGGKARVVRLPTKADDFFVRYHGTQDEFMSYLRMGRRVV